MSNPSSERSAVRKLLSAERGTVYKEAPERVALIYPSPYRAGISSLGFQTIYREINSSPGRAAERAFLPEDPASFRRSRQPLFCYESGRPVGDFRLAALSVAYELELSGVVEVLELSGIPPLAEERDQKHPLVLCGGPLTFANPLPLAPFADAILMGEADQTIHRALDIIGQCRGRAEALETLARQIESCFVPSIHGERTPAKARCDAERLPAYAPICTPHAELKDMFLIEAERGCSRGCAYCVMGNQGRDGMRKVPVETILRLIPENERRVGLVGAAVSDHPNIAYLVETLGAQGREVGLSSLRADRLDERLTAALAKAGLRTLTTALDGPSRRLRDKLGRRIREEHFIRAASLARDHRYRRMKLYVMVGVPDESDQDLEELAAFSSELARIHPLSLAVAPFVPKRGTPLQDAPFAGIKAIEDKLRKLRSALGERVDLRPTSARWAWVEYRLAQGGLREGRAVLEAVRAGGRFRDFRHALDR